MEHIELSIVIPVYNSQDTIRTVVESLHHLYDYLFTLEIILVNDGSKDDSHQVCEDLSNQYENVVVIHHATNGEQQLALMTGLRRCQGELVVLMDDDMQNPPGEVIKLMHKINEGYDVVMSKREIYNQSWTRKLASKLNQYLVYWSTKQRISFSNFLIMKRTVVSQIIKYHSSKLVIQGLILGSTANIANVVTEHHEWEKGKSNYNAVKLFKYWLEAAPYYIPPNIRYSLFLLAIMMTMGLTAGIYFMWRIIF